MSKHQLETISYVTRMNAKKWGAAVGRIVGTEMDNKYLPLILFFNSAFAIVLVIINVTCFTIQMEGHDLNIYYSQQQQPSCW